MSPLLEKSEFSFAAATSLLSKEQLYGPGVHCSYYSCLQLLLHILYEKRGRGVGAAQPEARIEYLFVKGYLLPAQQPEQRRIQVKVIPPYLLLLQ